MKNNIIIFNIFYENNINNISLQIIFYLGIEEKSRL